MSFQKPFPLQIAFDLCFNTATETEPRHFSVVLYLVHSFLESKYLYKTSGIKQALCLSVMSCPKEEALCAAICSVSGLLRLDIFAFCLFLFVS